jgi:DHA1 family bicyclomycin/chloramphenicol resistance-like MFS transporter
MLGPQNNTPFMNILLTLLLAGLTMVGPLAIDTYLPSFPAIAKTFEASPLLIQQTLSMFLFCFAFMMLFYGTLSDSFGRRPVILVSLVL